MVAARVPPNGPRAARSRRSALALGAQGACVAVRAQFRFERDEIRPHAFSLLPLRCRLAPQPAPNARPRIARHSSAKSLQWCELISALGAPQRALFEQFCGYLPKRACVQRAPAAHSLRSTLAAKLLDAHHARAAAARVAHRAVRGPGRRWPRCAPSRCALQLRQRSATAAGSFATQRAHQCACTSYALHLRRRVARRLPLLKTRRHLAQRAFEVAVMSPRASWPPRSPQACDNCTNVLPRA